MVDRNCPEYGICPVYGELTLRLYSQQFVSMKATCIETRNNKIERILFFNLDQFDIHVKVDETDNNMINDKYVYKYNLYL